MHVHIHIYIYKHTPVRTQRDQQQTSSCTLTPPTGEVVNKVVRVVHGNRRVRACAVQVFKLFLFALISDKVIGRKRTAALQAVTCCWLYVCLCLCVSVQYSRRTCLVRPQVASSWAGGGAKFLALYLVKLRGVALDSDVLGHVGPFPTSSLWIITNVLCMWVCMIRVYKTDGLTSPKHHCTSRFCVARVGVFWTWPYENMSAVEWGYTESNGECQFGGPPCNVLVSGTSGLSDL
jgi:hypothetical protein